MIFKHEQCDRSTIRESTEITEESCAHKLAPLCPIHLCSCKERGGCVRRERRGSENAVIAFVVPNNSVNASLPLPATGICCRFSPTGSDLLYCLLHSRNSECFKTHHFQGPLKSACISSTNVKRLLIRLQITP